MNVYQWALPEDISPLQNPVESIIRGDRQVLLVASSVQLRHIFEVAERMAKREALHEALSRLITSVGPLTSEQLHHRGLSVDIECTRPKMRFLVQEAAEKSAEILGQKRGLHAVRMEDQLYPLFLSLRGRICVLVGGNEMA